MDLESITMLIVDDEPADVALLQRTLERVGFSRLYATTDTSRFEEFLGRLQPDLILLDLHLSDIHGQEALLRLKNEPSTRQIPVVILSADASLQQAGRLLSQGAVAYLTKPLEVTGLLAALHKHLR